MFCKCAAKESTASSSHLASPCGEGLALCDEHTLATLLN